MTRDPLDICIGQNCGWIRRIKVAVKPTRFRRMICAVFSWCVRRWAESDIRQERDRNLPLISIGQGDHRQDYYAEDMR